MDLASAEAKARAREAAARLAADADDQVRYLAERAVTPLAALDRASADARYKDPHEGAVWRAGRMCALGDYAGDDVTDALVSALSDPHPWVRRAAARSLSRIAERGSVSEAAKPKVREGLERAAKDADASVKEAAVKAVEELQRRGTEQAGGE
jgi:HEAT repeat protein